MSFIVYLVTFIYSTRSLCNFYIFIEYSQPEEKDEELELLRTAVNGEIHIIYRFGGEIYTIMSKNALINVKSHQEFTKFDIFCTCTHRPTQR